MEEKKNIFSIIVATANNNAIGRDGGLLWHIHEDMIYFKNTTKCHPVIMGRKTWESLQVKPLPKRENIVITTDKEFTFDGVKVLHSLEEIGGLPYYENEVFVIGGGSIYKEFLPLCRKIYMTKVFRDYEDADTFFPEINYGDWNILSESEIKTDSESGTQFQFIVLERK